jgi:hypothetical protein
MAIWAWRAGRKASLVEVDGQVASGDDLGVGRWGIGVGLGLFVWAGRLIGVEHGLV